MEALRALHSSPCSQENEKKLTSFWRLNISIDVALVLDYHNQGGKDYLLLINMINTTCKDLSSVDKFMS